MGKYRALSIRIIPVDDLNRYDFLHMYGKVFNNLYLIQAQKIK